jgi:two-component system cell cycle sensor histidine kinase/response regulator CckA
MEVISQLSSGVAHDFNNILGVIIGYSDLIALDLGPESPLRNMPRRFDTLRIVPPD